APAHARDDRARGDDGGRRYGRDDLGPSVRGFGDAVPAFMLIPIPRPRRDPVAAAEQDAEAA
ncbi:MAG: DNA helicase, partial [Acetobacteraceae bacterium]|nr:DNA helicase [Acetobacteraceae bacterium]